jgi:hypothetical protein
MDTHGHPFALANHAICVLISYPALMHACMVAHAMHALLHSIAVPCVVLMHADATIRPIEDPEHHLDATETMVEEVANTDGLRHRVG